MRLVKTCLANINTNVGDFVANTDKAIAAATIMATQRQGTIGCFQEQTISGYPCEDWVQWPSFVEQQWEQLERFVDQTKEYATVFTIGVTIGVNGNLYNCVAVVRRGEILGLVPKEKLPTYNVFYEGRTFSCGMPDQLEYYNNVPFGDMIFRFPFGTLAVEVCEDIWSPDGPMRRRAYSGAELIINASASPWRAGVVGTRREMIATRASDNQATVVYVNQVGGQDALVFDGGGFICQNGRMLFEAPRWKKEGGVYDYVINLDVTRTARERNTTWRTDARAFLSKHHSTHMIESGYYSVLCGAPEELVVPENHSVFLPFDKQLLTPLDEYFEDLLSAMKMGLAGYFEKSRAFKRIVIALSGGKDSVLTLFVAWMYANDKFAHLQDSERLAAIKDFIWCASMPTRFNSQTTRSISEDVCSELGVTFGEHSIQDAFTTEMAATKEMSGGELTSLTIQNIQARIRGMRMWNLSNSVQGLWLQTGNMTERAVGYTTIGGDLMGGYSLIGNLPKTVVIELLRYISRTYPASNSLRSLLATKASAELADNQSDEDDLMPFAVLDACFGLFIEEKLSPAELYLRIRGMFSDNDLLELSPKYTKGMLKQWVKKFVLLFSNSIFKWVQAPQTVHLGSLDLDRERALQLPVVWSKQWLRLEELDALPD